MNFSRLTAVGLIAVTCSVAGLAGCGGSDSASSSAAETAATEATTEDFAATATKICTDLKVITDESAASFSTAVEEGDVEAAATALGLTVGVAQGALGDLQALTPPADVADDYTAFLDATKASVDALGAIVEGTSATTVDELVTEVEGLSNDSDAEAAAAANAAGLPECAGDDE